jgi:hypothetical protein
MSRKLQTYLGAAIGAIFIIAIAAIVRITSERSGSVEGYYLIGHGAMPVSAPSFGSAKYYLGGNKYVEVDRAFPDGAEERTGDVPSVKTLQEVAYECMPSATSTVYIAQRHEVTFAGIHYVCRTVILLPDEVFADHVYAAYPRDGVNITAWQNPDQTGQSVTIPAGAVVSILDTPDNSGDLHFSYRGQKYWSNNDVIQFFVP